MLGMLGGNKKSVDAVQSSLGRTIDKVERIDDGDGELRITFVGGSVLAIRDDGRSCCESRYMTCDDDLTSFAGDTLTGVEVVESETTNDNYGDPHEHAFLKVRTNRGVLTCETHNEHNGYYGGFWFKATLTEATQ